MAKREMTGAAALQSYPENRSANLHNGGGSFATVDRAAAFQLSVEVEIKNKKGSRCKENSGGGRRRMIQVCGASCWSVIDSDGKRKRQRGSVAESRRQWTLVFVLFFPSAGFNSTVGPRESIRSHSAPGSASPVDLLVICLPHSQTLR